MDGPSSLLQETNYGKITVIRQNLHDTGSRGTHNRDTGSDGRCSDTGEEFRNEGDFRGGPQYRRLFGQSEEVIQAGGCWA
jgi:hypothetical protein